MSRILCVLAVLLVPAAAGHAAPKKPTPALVKQLIAKDYETAYETAPGTQVTLAWSKLAIKAGRPGDAAKDGIPATYTVFPVRAVFVQTYDSGPEGYTLKKRFTLQTIVFRDGTGWTYKVTRQ